MPNAYVSSIANLHLLNLATTDAECTSGLRNGDLVFRRVRVRMRCGSPVVPGYSGQARVQRRLKRTR